MVLSKFRPVCPFWKKVPENMLGLPENSFLLNASLITGHEFKTTTGLVPKKMLKMSPYFWPNFLQLLPTFLASMNGMWPTRGRPIGPAIIKFLKKPQLRIMKLRLPGGKFLGLIEVFRMEMIKMAAIAAPTIKSGDIVMFDPAADFSH